MHRGGLGSAIVREAGEGTQFVSVGGTIGGNGNGRNVDPEYADGEESEKGFGEHDDGEWRKRAQMTTAPGLKLERLKKGTGGSCTAAEETREPASNLLYISGNRWVQVRVVEFQLVTGA